jgi:thymidine kinase
MRAWRAGRAAARLEVNHREPALGAHRTLSCVHHLDNLETLCVACHRLATATQRPLRREP